MDVLLVGFIAGFTFGGWRTGFLRRALGLIFIVVAAVLGAYLRYPFGAIATTFFKGIPEDYAALVGYTFAFPAILAALHIAQHFLIGKVAVQGLTRGMDSALGAVFGFLEAVLILSVVVVVVDTYFGTKATLPAGIPPTLLGDFTKAFNASTTVQILQSTTVPFLLAILGPLLPKDLSVLLPTGIPDKLPFPSIAP